MADNANTVWSDAEDDCLSQLATTTGSVVGQNAFIGSDVSLSGKLNSFVFAIGGGEIQDQSYTSGSSSWHTKATLQGVYTTRDAAMAVGSKIQDATPFKSVSESVTWLFTTTYPAVKDGAWDEGDGKALRIVYKIEIIFDVVYHVVDV